MLIRTLINRIKGTTPTPIDIFKIDRTNRIVYKAIDKKKYASEPLFTCTICQKRTTIDTSFTANGCWFMCNKCYNEITEEVNDFPLTEYIND